MITQIGEHRIRCGDVFDDLSELVTSKVDFVYTDPPWGKGNLKYWQTINNKMTGAAVKDVPEIDVFINRIFDVIMESTKDDAIIFIEYGVRWTEQVISISKLFGLITSCIMDPVYSSKNLPLKLILMSRNKITINEGYEKSVSRTKGYDTLLAATAPFNLSGKKIFDPCCGLGYTSKLAIDKGMVFYGNELNAARLKKTESRLRG